MIAADLRSGLKRRLEKLFDGEVFNAPNGERVPLSIFEQSLPKKKTKEDEFYPLIIVKIFSGEKKGRKDPNYVDVGFVIGIYDNGTDNQGYQHIEHIMNKIIKDLSEYPMIDDQFERDFPLRWQVIDEGTEPFYHGGIEATFIMPEPIMQPPEEARDFL